MAKAPPLHRLARAFGLLALVVTVVIVVLVAAAVDSAARLRPQGDGYASSATPLANQTVKVSTAVTVNNPGWFAVDRLAVTARVSLPGPNGTLLATGGSPDVRVPAGTNVTFPLDFFVPISGPTGEMLATHDLELPALVWVNATYATLFSVRLVIPSNYSWGAPPEGLNVSAGPPTNSSGGSISVPVTVAFQNNAKFAVDGRVAIVVENSGGTSCGSGQLGLRVAPSMSYDNTTSIRIVPGCMGSGPGTIVPTAFIEGWTVALPTEPFP